MLLSSLIMNSWSQLMCWCHVPNKTSGPGCFSESGIPQTMGSRKSFWWLEIPSSNGSLDVILPILHAPCEYLSTFIPHSTYHMIHMHLSILSISYMQQMGMVGWSFQIAMGLIFSSGDSTKKSRFWPRPTSESYTNPTCGLYRWKTSSDIWNVPMISGH